MVADFGRSCLPGRTSRLAATCVHVNRQYRLAVSLAGRTRFACGDSPFRQKGPALTTIRYYTPCGAAGLRSSAAPPADKSGFPGCAGREMAELHEFPGCFSLIRQKSDAITCFRAPTVKQFGGQKSPEPVNPLSHTMVEQSGGKLAGAKLACGICFNRSRSRRTVILLRTVRKEPRPSCEAPSTDRTIDCTGCY
jgi:hypothetical protein